MILIMRRHRLQTLVDLCHHLRDSVGFSLSSIKREKRIRTKTSGFFGSFNVIHTTSFSFISMINNRIR